MKPFQDTEESRTLARLEREWITALRQHDIPTVQSMIAADFTYSSDTAVLDKKGFLARLEEFDLGEKTIELIDERIRIFGTAAISTGAASFRQPSRDQVDGSVKVASGSAVVNLGELAREEKREPARTRRGVPPPGPVSQDRPVQVAKPEYRYTAVYVRLRGRWQMVALHLSTAK